MNVSDMDTHPNRIRDIMMSINASVRKHCARNVLKPELQPTEPVHESRQKDAKYEEALVQLQESYHDHLVLYQINGTSLCCPGSYSISRTSILHFLLIESKIYQYTETQLLRKLFYRGFDTIHIL